MGKWKEIVVVPWGTVPKLARHYKVSETCVYNALAFRSNSEIAENIRMDALKNYGAIKSKKYLFNRRGA